MNPVTGAVLTTVALWLMVGGIAVSEVRKKLRDRRLDREARERRDRAAGVQIAAGLKSDPEPPLSGEESAA